MIDTVVYTPENMLITLSSFRMEESGVDRYDLKIRDGKLGDGLRVFLSRAQLESIRDQINGLFPLEPVADPRDFPGSIAPSLLAGEGGAP